LYQALDLLYMPLLDLQQHLKQELLNNPFLELVEPDEDSDEDEDDVESSATEEAAATSPEEQQKADNDEIDWEEILLDGFDAGGRRAEHEEKEDGEPETGESSEAGRHRTGAL